MSLKISIEERNVSFFDDITLVKYRDTLFYQYKNYIALYKEHNKYVYIIGIYISVEEALEAIKEYRKVYLCKNLSFEIHEAK
jgi:hypothetical protein